MSESAEPRIDVVLVGAGIMSSTLGVVLKAVHPSLRITMFEALDKEAQESSGAWNNAGTGHAALCELNYTPAHEGGVDVHKAIAINTEFDLSRQLWASLVRTGAIAEPARFVRSVPHFSFVRGHDDVAFLQQRHAAMTAHHCFTGMELSNDAGQLREWLPLVMTGREPGEPVAATRMAEGTDVDYGALTSALLQHLQRQDDFEVCFRHRVSALERTGDGGWRVTAEGPDGKGRTVSARFVFLGAGGGALPLLQKSKIPEAEGYAGFPVSGIWLRCDNDALAARHHAKVYGRAAVGAPPMSVPHLDTRIVDGTRHLLFGPFAGVTSRFLKHGSLSDLFLSMRPQNLGPMLAVARDDFHLVEYLIEQSLDTEAQRLDALRDFLPELDEAEWRQQEAGQRVQIIKRDGKRGGVLEFGTELVSAKDGSIVGLLGASPGASVSAWIAVQVLERCFANELSSLGWAQKLKQLIPSYGESLSDDGALCRKLRAETAQWLGLHH